MVETLEKWTGLLTYTCALTEFSFLMMLSGIEYRSSRTEEPFQELNKKSVALKRILARIPEEISDRKTFLETIKYFIFPFPIITHLDTYLV